MQPSRRDLVRSVLRTLVPRNPGRLALGWLVLAALVPGSVASQSSTSASITGTVRGSDFAPVPQALVSLRLIGSGGGQEARTTASGTFRFELVRPGAYELRVEALGYRPLVARTLTLAGGDASSVSLTLTVEPPPVTRVDTLVLAGSTSTRFRPAGLQLGGAELSELPYRFDDLAAVTSLSTAFDGSMGSLGLPGDLSLLVADGVPFYRAPHPTARQELLPDAAFPRATLAGVTALHNPTDIELTGSAGGYVAVSTAGALPVGSVEVEGAYSGDPVWSSSELDIDKPGLLSWQGGARGMIPVTPTSRVYTSLEGFRQETPLTPRVPGALASELASLDADLLSSLTDPGVEAYERYAGLARFDASMGTASQLFLRASGGYARRSFTGAGPLSASGVSALAEESSDIAAALGVVTQYTRSTTFELRTGFSGSFRDFDGRPADVPPAYLSGSGASLGSLPVSGAASNRTDLVAIPSFRWSPGNGATTFKAGSIVRVSSHEMSHAGGPDLIYSGAPELLSGNGFGRWTSSAKAEFGTQEYGIFAQYESRLSPTLRVRAGARYDYESLRGDPPPLNAELQAVTGLNTAEFDREGNQYALRASLVWTPAPDGATTLYLSGSMEEGDFDLRAIAELYATATDGTQASFLGSGVAWPDGMRPGAATPLPAPTLLSPDTRPPRTTLLEVGAQQRLGDVGSVFVRATSRRTDFLTRRRNLNRALTPQALDPYGRGVFGTLQQSGSLVVTSGTDARRFPDFAAIWALDPDGWSEYLGATIGFERRGPTFDLYAAYSWSETTDNWVGAAGGDADRTVPPGLPAGADEAEWSEGTSDFDVPHRISLGATARVGPASVSTFYRFRSGLPFTPTYRSGVDANGDGTPRNDVAWIPAAGIGALEGEWACLSENADGFAVRNSCRRSAVHTVNVRVAVTLARFGGRVATMFLDGLDLLESTDGVVDDALLLVDPAGSITTSPDGSTVTLPTVVNPGFGEVLYPSSRGRMLRVGLRIGG